MRTVYSVGHSNRDVPALLALLRQAGVAAVADVRRVPASRRHPWFAKGPLDAALASAGIRYRWLGDGLGGRRSPAGAGDVTGAVGHRDAPREPSRNGALRDASFRAYADAFGSDAFRRDLAALEALAADVPTALLCAERDWRHCHRQLLADVLTARGWQVVHLVDESHTTPHALTEWARVEGNEVSYPALL